MVRIPFPEDQYLLALGQLSYAVGYLEWSILGDLSSMPGLPEGISVSDLAGLSTGAIGRRLTTAGDRTADPKLKEWLITAGDALREVAARRNSILHARPATVGGQQRLYRWDIGRRETFEISEAFLREALEEVDRRVIQMGSLRWPTGRLASEEGARRTNS